MTRVSTPLTLPRVTLADVLHAQIRVAGLPEPDREYEFAKAEIGRKWAIDLCYHDRKLAIECEGGVWRGGKGGGAALSRHGYGTGIERDCEKHCWLAILGWRLLRFTSTTIRNGEALRLLERALQT